MRLITAKAARAGMARRPSVTRAGWSRAALLVALVGFGVVASGCDWTMFGYNLGNTRSSSDTGISTSNVSSLGDSWSSNNVTLSGNGDSITPISESNGIVYAEANGYLNAFSATSCPAAPANCAPLWVSRAVYASSDMHTAPVISNNEIYVSNGAQILAYSTDYSGCPVVSGTIDCAPLRIYDDPGGSADPPLVDNDHLYAPSSGKVFSADGTQNCSLQVGWYWPPNSGTEIPVCEPIWTYVMPSGYAGDGGTPAIATATNGPYSGQSLLYMNGWENGGYASTFAFDANGSLNCSSSSTVTTCTTLRWFLTTGSSDAASPVVANGSLYVNEEIGTGGFIAVYDQNGVKGCGYVCAPLYEDMTNTHYAINMAVTSTEVLFPTTQLMAFNATGCGQSTCPPLWKTASNCENSVGASVANGVVYVGTSSPCSNGVNAYDATSGALLKSFASPDNQPVYVSPTIANGVLYFGTAARDLYAYSP